jgi:hypothetical protein
LCLLNALHALVRALYTGVQKLSCAPEVQPSRTFFLDVTEQCCGVCLPSPI